MEEQYVSYGQVPAAQLWVHGTGHWHYPGLVPQLKVLGAKSSLKPWIPKAMLVQILAVLKVQWDKTRKACVIKAGKLSLSLALKHGYFEASLVFYKLWEAAKPKLVCFKEQPHRSETLHSCLQLTWSPHMGQVIAKTVLGKSCQHCQTAPFPPPTLQASVNK